MSAGAVGKLIEAGNNLRAAADECAAWKGQAGSYVDYAQARRDWDAAAAAAQADLARAGEVWQAHRPATNDEQQPGTPFIAGYCVRCFTPWPCQWSPESKLLPRAAGDAER